MKRIKVLSLIAFSIMISACSNVQYSDESATVKKVNVDISTYKLELSRNVVLQVKECDYFLLTSNNVNNKANCTSKLEENFSAYLEDDVFSKKIQEYGESEKVGDISLSSENETPAVLLRNNNVSYVKEMNFKNDNIYELIPGTMETVESYSITPFILPNEQIIIKYVIENSTKVKDGSGKKGMMLRIEGNKVLTDSKKTIFSIVNPSGRTYIIKTITATIENKEY